MAEQRRTYSDAASQKKGLFMARLFSSFSVSVSVALNSSVCLRAGTASRITSRSAVKSAQPCSNNRSASSNTSTQPQIDEIICKCSYKTKSLKKWGRIF